MDYLLVRAILVKSALMAHLRPAAAEAMYWSWPHIQRLFTVAQSVKPDLWVANDWDALPIVTRLAQINGGVYVYDAHEFAVNEYPERWKWRLLYRSVVRNMESQSIRGAKVVSTVSGGIADALHELYQLPARPAVIRSAPRYSQSPFRPTGETIRLLYHGIVAPGRGLEEAIASVPFWRPHFNLWIRGPGNPEYLQSLKNIIHAQGVDDRVTLLPPVPMVELVERAREFDVGFFALKGHSLQNHFVLPNKFFEYTMAGLALCVSDLPEMTRLCEQYKHGVVFKGVDKNVIAEAVNKLDASGIDEMKRRSIAASSDLCWENEASRMVALYEEAVSDQRCAESGCPSA